ncbi:zinc-dependent alcohol dehydrogenase [Paenibacillus thermotolerans]|uniref:zinc-dependent alcohol dehydrogenase n=1 Tax=Paenibacillus thermotolerans TaxID=3027807 RepID=UPI002367ECD4|nr:MULTISPECIES: zinc-binding alcohol dehydrogenase [unclassified Paenibacillus]
MKAIAAQNGKIVIKAFEAPIPSRGHLLVRTEFSAISPGTEMTALTRSSDQPAVLGYSAVGRVERIGEDVTGYEIGQRVACYGAPYARHAELLSMPSNLTAKLPDHVTSEEAAFAGLGAIAIHALRTANLQFGEAVIIVGLGILGHMTAQIASAAGYRTAGIDLNAARAEQLRRQGLRHVYCSQEELERELTEITGGFGADAVLLCAAGPGEQLINRSFEWIRDRGKVVVVGDLTTEFSRAKMFGKEAQVLISRAGGPGRYDASYERNNVDYPVGYVRWTEGRNIAEYVRLLAEKRIAVSPLITGVYPLEQAAAAYEQYARSSDSTLGTLLRYQ